MSLSGWQTHYQSYWWSVCLLSLLLLVAHMWLQVVHLGLVVMCVLCKNISYVSERVMRRYSNAELSPNLWFGVRFALFNFEMYECMISNRTYIKVKFEKFKLIQM